MSGVAVYMEGGGDSAEGKAPLRRGMGEFLRSLRDAARQKRLDWKVVACGSRNDAHDAFVNATRNSPQSVNILLVDSEGSVANPLSPRTHLIQRDGWDLTGVGEDSVHLMIQAMEAWIVADGGAVANYYGQHFLKGALPGARNLEGIGKALIEQALKRATAQTQKKEYQKIRDAAALLERIDPGIVRRRCPSCERLFTTLSQTIEGITKLDNSVA